ncbi:MAG TPA: FAD-dependent oxidoreductase [Thermoleophilaceae bacterium]|jgi:monoamine oxidase
MQHDVDVVVVGAGLAGLAAARASAAAGVEPLVVEARDRVGGRVLDEPLGADGAIERGAAFVGSTQDRMRALAAETGVPLFDTHATGSNLVEVAGRVTRFTGTIPRLGPVVLADFAQAQLKLDRLARRVDPEAPWLARGAGRLDAQSFGSWMRRNLATRRARRLLAGAANTVWGTEPEDMSLLYVLAYLRAAGGLDPVLDTVGGAQHHRLAGGPQLVARRVADALGDRVLLGAPVRRIEHGAEGVVVRAGGVDASARRAIVAVPPPLAARIEYDPPLPGARDQLAQRMPMGSLMKCFAVYDEPFWRRDGLTGEAVSDAGPAKIVFDCSPPGGSPGVLLGFVGGAAQRTLGGGPAGERRAAVLAGFARLFGPRAERPDRYLEQDWTAEPWSRGGPVAYMTTGAITAFGRVLREPVGPVHWAGTETAAAWTGYMDGAVRSGERAAAEALAAIGAARPRTPAGAPAR